MAKTETTPDNTPVYSPEEICANSETAFGVKPEVAAGALYGSGKSAFTIAEVKALIEAFKRKEVR